MATRKPKTSRAQTIAGKRQEQKAQRERAKARAHQLRHDRRRWAFGVMKERWRIVRRYWRLLGRELEREAAEAVAAAERIGQSTLRRWSKLAREGGKRALLPAWQQTAVEPRTPPEIRMLIVGWRVVQGWGPQRIQRELVRRGLYRISHMGVYRILRRYHLPTKTYHPRGVQDGVVRRRYEKQRPHELWHLDFKGPLKLENGQAVWIALLIDDYSRFCLGWRVCEAASTEEVLALLEEARQRYGTPRAVLTDNGRAFTSVWEDGHHRFEETLRAQGIATPHTAPYYPESNGKVERFIQIVIHECLEGEEFADEAALSTALERFVTYYNYYRPHGSLDGHAPVYRLVGQEPGIRGLVYTKLDGETVGGVPNEADPLPEVTAETIARQTALVPVR